MFDNKDQGKESNYCSGGLFIKKYNQNWKTNIVSLKKQ